MTNTKKIKIYTWGYCPFCIRAKRLLTEEKLEFEEVCLDGKDEQLKELVSKTKYKTVPQIFIGDEMIGGFSELSNLRQSGKLREKLKAL